LLEIRKISLKIKGDLKMKRNIFIWLVAMIILIVFSTLVFASGTINVKDYIKDKLPAIFSFYLSSLEDLDSYEKEFIDLLQNLPEEEEQKSFAKEVYNDGFSKEILEKIKREGVIAKTKTEIKGKKAEYRGTKFVYIDLPDGQLLKIEYGNDVVYGVMRIKDKYSFCEIGSEDIQEKEKEFHVEEAYAYENHLIKVHGEIVINNRLVKISGYNLRVEYTSLTPDIAIINESGGIEWKDKGLAKFKVSVFEHNSNIELGNSVVEVNVIKLPIITGYYGFSSVEEVIQKLGFPDRETEAYFEWYEESGYFEDIYYPFSSDSCGTFVQHWSYDKYPYLRIKNSTQVYTQGWDSLY
jgi:hypothetical protein